jgi:YlmC/YmxH family sporulation protein
MGVRFTDLHCKEVVCVSDGRRLGFISDMRVDVCDGRIAAIIVPGQCRLGGIWGGQEDYVIPWSSICRIGPDIVLVDIDCEKCRVPKARFNPRKEFKL